MTLKQEKILRRLNKLTKIVDNHWLFVGHRNKLGYGKLKIGGRKGKLESIGRLSLWIYKEFDLFSSLYALHIKECIYKNCWNPEHLYSGTQKENMKDMFDLGKGRVARHWGRNQVLCLKGHELTKRKNGIRFCRECHNARRRKEA